MPLQHANSIDIIAQDPSTNEVVLGMTEFRPWDGSDRRVWELQEKVNAYLSFALDGEMVEAFPHLADKRIRLQLDCVEEPDDKMKFFINLVREQIGFQGVEFTVKVDPKMRESEAAAQYVGGGCGCGHGGGCCGGGAEEAHAHTHSHEGCCGGQGSHGAEDGCCGGGSDPTEKPHGGCGCSG